MEENNQKLGVGLVVIASGIIGVLLLLFFGKMPAFLSDRYRVTINFPSAPRVTRDTPVRKSGVQIGRVASVKLLDDNQGVNLVLELDRAVKVAHGETCRITTGSLITNDAVVEFTLPTQSTMINRFDGVNGGEKNNILDQKEKDFARIVMADGDYLTGGVVTVDPLEMMGNMQGNLSGAFSAIEQTARRADSVLAKLDDALGGNDGQLQDVAQRARVTIDNFNQTMQSIDRVARQFEQANLPQTIGDTVSRMPFLFNEAERVLAQAQTTLRGFEDLGPSLQQITDEFKGIGNEARATMGNANRALENIADFTQPLGEQSDEIVAKLVRTLDNFDASLQDIRVFTQKLNNSDGTIARLMDDDQLYYQVIATLENIRQVSNRLQPIVNDVRTITDKVARDPSQMGVKGLLRANPNGAGLK